MVKRRVRKKEKRSRAPEDKLLEALSQVLVEERMKAGLGQSEVAEAAGFKRPYVSRVEHGCSLGLRNLYKLAAALKVKPSVLMRQAERLAKSKDENVSK